jgi:hypothetical protein
VILIKIPRINPTFLRNLIGVFLGSVVAGACANSRMGDAEVRQEFSAPCFTITLKEEQRTSEAIRLQALIVTDMSTKPSVRVWSFRLQSNHLKHISSNDCIIYDKAPLDSSDIVKAIPLKSGKVYEVFLNARSADESDSTFGYKAKFCLLNQNDGKVKVHQLHYKDGWHEEVCKP